MKNFTILLTVLYFIVSACHENRQKALLVSSNKLGIELLVTLHETGTSEPEKPVIYVTDGEEFTDRNIPDFLDSLAQVGLIPDACYAFVGSIDRRTGQNVRNEIFFCNQDFLQFFENEIIPKVEEELELTIQPGDRGLIGVSFGGLNAAYMSIEGTQIQNFIMLSPITYPCQDLHTNIAFSKATDLRFWISTGKNDTETYVEPLEVLLRNRGYQVKLYTASGGHDFETWKDQLSAAVRFLINK